MKSFPLWVVGALLCFLTSCQDAPKPSSSGPEHLPLKIEGHTLHAEVVRTPARKARGLMFRDHLDENAGMLFVFSQPRRASFYMRDTRIPLSIAYIDATGTILEIYDMEPFDETSVVSRSDEIAYALEVNQGWFDQRGIRPGAVLSGLPARAGHGAATRIP